MFTPAPGLQYELSSGQREETVTLTRCAAQQNQEAVRVSQGVREGNDRRQEASVGGRGGGSLGPVSCLLYSACCVMFDFRNCA